MAKKIENTPEHGRVHRTLEKLYLNRFTTLKSAMSHSLEGRYQSALQEYLSFLKIISSYNNFNENNISAAFFKNENRITEIFLISQVFWDLSKIYDRDARYMDKMKFYLEKFLEFSKGFKFQYANSQLVLKFLKSGRCRNTQEFEMVYKTLNTQKDYCYISSYCFGEDHAITNDLRLLKKFLLKKGWGKKMVNYYYYCSPKLLNFCRRYVFIGLILRCSIFYPVLFLTYIFWDNKIFRRLW